MQLAEKMTLRINEELHWQDNNLFSSHTRSPQKANTGNEIRRVSQLITLETTPAPTVRPPSLRANLCPAIKTRITRGLQWKESTRIYLTTPTTIEGIYKFEVENLKESRLHFFLLKVK